MYYFNELIHVLYLMKQLHDLGKSEIVEHLYDWELNDGEDIDLSVCQDAAFSVIQGIFNSYQSIYDDDYYDNCETIILSDKVIKEYYRLAGMFWRGKKKRKKDNPYVTDAKNEAERHFNFSYCLDWRLRGYTTLRRSSESGFDIFISYDGDVDIAGVAIGVVDMYNFFKEKLEELKRLLSENKKTRPSHIRRASKSAKSRIRKSGRTKKAALRSPRRVKRDNKRCGVQKVRPFITAELPEQREAIAA